MCHVVWEILSDGHHDGDVSKILNYLSNYQTTQCSIPEDSQLILVTMNIENITLGNIFCEVKFCEDGLLYMLCSCASFLFSLQVLERTTKRGRNQRLQMARI
jgi:hypothetical protein